VAQSRPMSDVLPELLHFIGSRPLVGYWIQFDVRMLNKYLLAMIDTPLPNPRLDVSEPYYHPKYRSAPPGPRGALRHAASRADLKLPARAQHDAFEDALGAAEMFLVLEDMRQRSVRLPRRPPEVRGDFAIA